MPTLNQRIVSYAQSKLGTKVGNGECWTLANNALRAAGAVTPSGSGASLYVWGRIVAQSRLAAGNIIQFSNYQLRIDNPDGSWRTLTRGAPRHTAIVESVGSNGAVVVLEANVDASKKVRRTTLYLRSGEVDGSTVTVSGSFVCYQAVARS